MSCGQLTKKKMCPQRVTKCSTPRTVFSLDQRAMANIAMTITMGPAQNLQKNSQLQSQVVIKSSFRLRLSACGLKINSFAYSPVSYRCKNVSPGNSISTSTCILTALQIRCVFFFLKCLFLDQILCLTTC